MEIPKYARRGSSNKNIVLVGRPVPSHARIHIGETFGALKHNIQAQTLSGSLNFEEFAMKNKFITHSENSKNNIDSAYIGGAFKFVHD